jgi:amidohydrolase
MSDPIRNAAQALHQETTSLRRDFHQHPEIAFEEVRTSGIVAERMKGLGLETKTGIGKTGVVSVLDTGKPGKTVLLRADMDALPVAEEKSVSYKSTLEGKNHACGHDGHTAILLASAKILTSMKQDLSGKYVFVFQPAEEIVKGAQAMLADGALNGLNPDASIGLHLTSSYPTGTVAIREGPAMAAADAFRIVVSGRGGHAAMPQTGVDPIVIGSSIVTTLQTLVSRETDPVDQSVISITSFHGGTAFNIIPESVELKGTLRTFNANTRSYLHKRILIVVKGLAETLRGSAEIEWIEGSPAVVNDASYTERFRQVAIQALGESKVLRSNQIMGGDDMSLWLQQAPGCYFFVGSGNLEKASDYPHHHPKFDLDETAFPIAIELLTKGALEYSR